MKKRWLVLALGAALLAIPQGNVRAAEKDHWDGAYYIKDGEKVTGLQQIGKKQYYFGKNKKLVKEKRAYVIKVNGKTGYYNIDTKGVATKWTGIYEMAAKQLHTIKAVPSKVSEKNLTASMKKAFLWSAELKYVNNTKKLSDKKALKYYAEYGFARKRGDCNTQAATFCCMAKVLGFDAKFVRGYFATAVTKKGKITAANPHAWVTTYEGGSTCVYDPNFNTSSLAASLKKANKYVGFRIRYGAKKTLMYCNAKKVAYTN